MAQAFQAPTKTSYDVVIIGGAKYGSSVAWWLTQLDGFNGSILVVERDPTYENSSTARTNSCMRQQFSAEINVQISQFAAEFVKSFQDYFPGDDRVPPIAFQSYGYMYLADNAAFAEVLKDSQAIQQRLGSGTKHMSAEEIKAAYPFYNVDDIVAGNHNLIDEGYYDGNTVFDWWRRSARERGAEYLANEVVAIGRDATGTRVETVTLSTGETVSCGTVVNCAGPRAVEISRMIGCEIPVEPRKRFTFIFDAAQPLDRDLPLTIDPSGVHMRTDGQYYLAGCPPEHDPAVDYDDLEIDHSVWEDKVWPVIANRIPQFEAIKLTNTWMGHYAFNTFDQNAIIGPHDAVDNFIFVNGFSGHGFQQSPAMGRGVAELITHGSYQTLDLTPFGYDRIVKGAKFIEKAVI